MSASLKSVVRRREGRRRLIVLLGVFNFMCYIFTYNGTEGTHRYYYAQAGSSSLVLTSDVCWTGKVRLD